jgi:peptidoglycan biosynthesis protein MviN/MurJ (putative lipid II flippase)
MNILRKGIGLILLKGVNAGLGFALALGVAMFLGSNQETDALLISLFIPVTIGNELISYLVLLLVPVLVTADTEKATAKWPAGLGLPLLAGTMGLCLLIGLAAHPLVRLMGPGLDSQALACGVALLRLQIPTFFLAVLFGLGHAWFNAERRFFAPEIGRLCWRLAALAGLVLCGNRWGAYGYAVSLLAASVIRALWVLPGPLVCPRFWSRRGLGQVKSTLNRGAAALTLLMVSNWGMYMITRAMASLNGEGRLTLFDYATRLAQFVPLLLARSVFTVILPEIVSSQKKGGCGVGMTQPITLIFLAIGLPLAGLLYWSAPFLAHGLCRYSRISFAGQEPLGAALQGLAVGVPAVLAHMNLKGIFLARQDVWSVFKISAVQMICLVLAMAMLRSWGLGGIGLAVSLSSWAVLLYLWWVLKVSWQVRHLYTLAAAMAILWAGFGLTALPEFAGGLLLPALALLTYSAITWPLCKTWNRDLIHAYRRINYGHRSDGLTSETVCKGGKHLWR